MAQITKANLICGTSVFGWVSLDYSMSHERVCPFTESFESTFGPKERNFKLVQTLMVVRKTLQIDGLIHVTGHNSKTEKRGNMTICHKWILINMRTKQQREATQRCEAGGRAGEHRDGWTDRQGRSYLLNLLVAGRHGRKNATKVKRQGKKCSELPKS